MDRYICCLVGKARQKLNFLNKLWRVGFSELVLLSFNKAAIESVLISCLCFKERALSMTEMPYRR